MSKLKDLFYNVKYKIQRMKKGYTDEDIWNMHVWFIKIIPKMLEEFCNDLIGCPCNSEDLKEEIRKFPIDWLEQQISYFDELNKKDKDYEIEYDLDDEFCCWRLIILRMKYCLELCDEDNSYYKKYYEKLDTITQLDDQIKIYDEMDNEIERHKEEAFYLLNKWFFNLWW